MSPSHGPCVAYPGTPRHGLLCRIPDAQTPAPADTRDAQTRPRERNGGGGRVSWDTHTPYPRRIPGGMGDNPTRPLESYPRHPNTAQREKQRGGGGAEKKWAELPRCPYHHVARMVIHVARMVIHVAGMVILVAGMVILVARMVILGAYHSGTWPMLPMSPVSPRCPITQTRAAVSWPPSPHGTAWGHTERVQNHIRTSGQSRAAIDRGSPP